MSRSMAVMASSNTACTVRASRIASERKAWLTHSRSLRHHAWHGHVLRRTVLAERSDAWLLRTEGLHWHSVHATRCRVMTTWHSLEHAWMRMLRITWQLLPSHH